MLSWWQSLSSSSSWPLSFALLIPTRSRPENKNFAKKSHIAKTHSQSAVIRVPFSQKRWLSRFWEMMMKNCLKGIPRRWWRNNLSTKIRWKQSHSIKNSQFLTTSVISIRQFNLSIYPTSSSTEDPEYWPETLEQNPFWTIWIVNLVGYAPMLKMEIWSFYGIKQAWW